MVLVKYQISHRDLPTRGAQFESVGGIENHSEIKRIVSLCIDMAKKVAIENNLSYEEMKHKLNGNFINPDSIMQLPDNSHLVTSPYVKSQNGSYSYESKTCAF